MSQRERILDALQKREWLSLADTLGWTPPIVALSQRIGDLKRQGYDIEERRVAGHPYSEYRLRKTAIEAPAKVWSCHAGAWHEVGCPHEEGKLFEARAANYPFPPLQDLFPSEQKARQEFNLDEFLRGAERAGEILDRKHTSEQKVESSNQPSLGI